MQKLMGQAKAEGLQAGLLTAHSSGLHTVKWRFCVSPPGTSVDDSPGAATSAMRQQVRPASLLTGGMSTQIGKEPAGTKLVHLWARRGGVLEAGYEAARGDRVMLLRVLRPCGTATKGQHTRAEPEGREDPEAAEQCRQPQHLCAARLCRGINSPCPSYTFSLSLIGHRASESQKGVEFARSMNVLRRESLCSWNWHLSDQAFYFLLGKAAMGVNWCQLHCVIGLLEGTCDSAMLSTVFPQLLCRHVPTYALSPTTADLPVDWASITMLQTRCTRSQLLSGHADREVLCSSRLHAHPIVTPHYDV